MSSIYWIYYCKYWMNCIIAFSNVKLHKLGGSLRFQYWSPISWRAVELWKGLWQFCALQFSTRLALYRLAVATRKGVWEGTTLFSDI